MVRPTPAQLHAAAGWPESLIIPASLDCLLFLLAEWRQHVHPQHQLASTAAETHCICPVVYPSEGAVTLWSGGRWSTTMVVWCKGLVHLRSIQAVPPGCHCDLPAQARFAMSAWRGRSEELRLGGRRRLAQATPDEESPKHTLKS